MARATTVPSAITLPPATRPAARPVAVAPPATRPGGAAAPVAVGPGTRPVAPGPGNFVNVGAVLMEVNGRPIFTDKVLSAIEAPLAAEAKKRNETSFRDLARAFVENQIRLYKRDELEFASAERTLGEEEKNFARGLTVQWRIKKITEAGGSLEVAKRRAADQGWEFDDLVEQQYRLHLIQIFYQKRVIPLIQVPARDLRTYYAAHKETEFTTHGAARFRVIKIDPRLKAGLKEEAYAQAQDVRKRAAKEDFAELAKDPAPTTTPASAPPAATSSRTAGSPRARTPSRKSTRPSSRCAPARCPTSSPAPTGRCTSSSWKT